MNAGPLFLLAMIVPLLLAAVLLLPPYLGMFCAAYFVYTPAEGASPIADKLYDVFYIVDVYQQLFHHWMANKTSLGLVDYTLPVIGLPLACAIFSIWLTRKVARKLLDVFHSFSGAGR